jgi:protein-disulfide isomerase
MRRVRVTRRIVLTATAFVVLVGGFFLWTQGGRLAHASWAQTETKTLSGPVAIIRTAPVSKPSDPIPQPGGEPAKEASSAPLPAPQANPGVPDVDPHVAFGSKNAPIVMEVFSDFQCPACKNLYMTTNRQLMDNYVSTGKVFLIHRDFPLQMHAHSKVAAQYSRAAAQIGKFEPVEQALFQNQEKWEQSGDVDGTVAAVLNTTEMTKVRALVKSGVPQASIDKDLALGRTYNVNQTPTTIFHSKGQTFPYAGNMSYDILRGFLDQLISQK